MRVIVAKGALPEDLLTILSQRLTNWLRQRPQLRKRCVLPINRDGNTVELHAWYEAHLFPPRQLVEQN